MNRAVSARYLLSALQLFIGAGAVGGGLGLVLDPSGTALGMSLQSLSDSPFEDYFLPGLVLLLVNGVGHCVAGWVTCTDRRAAGVLAMGLGAFLMGWIILQAVWIGLLHWLQPLYLALGLAEILLGRSMRR